MKLRKNNPGEGHQPHRVPGINDVGFFFLPLCPPPPAPAEADIGVQCIVCRPWVNLVKVRPQVEAPAGVPLLTENALWRRGRVSCDTSAAGYEPLAILRSAETNKGSRPRCLPEYELKQLVRCASDDTQMTYFPEKTSVKELSRMSDKGSAASK